MPAMKITPPYILAQEAFAVGLLTIVFGLIASAFVRALGVFDSDTGDWNANHIMEAALFFTDKPHVPHFCSLTVILWTS